ncbi:unnamed protein product [Ceratitis capitata]|uniref:(Mediterranean fruit fly) hypothetical protein n=1 Tax=Ceratitis capitata TaxID=7213 RepID=A0A811URV6_CERCA|nr:unnamed protein product [Ceratitis capitata]
MSEPVLRVTSGALCVIYCLPRYATPHSADFASYSLPVRALRLIPAEIPHLLSQSHRLWSCSPACLPACLPAKCRYQQAKRRELAAPQTNRRTDRQTDRELSGSCWYCWCSWYV